MTVPSQQLIDKVNELMSQGFELSIEKLVPEARLKEDLSLDSLDAVDMLVHIEERLEIKVDGEKIRVLKTLADVYELAANAVHDPVTPTATSTATTPATSNAAAKAIATATTEN
jgi:acyl carrier protein